VLDDFKYQDELWGKQDAKAFASQLILPGTRVLDLGCWSGKFGEFLRKEKKCLVTGVEINDQALLLARKRLKEVFKVDLNDPLALKKFLVKKTFDYITVLDVAEHLQNPEKLLLSLTNFLAPKGKLIVSVPNIANWEIRLALLRGKFEYTRTGILDSSHRRFFTLDSFKDLLESSGFKIEKMYFNGKKLKKFFPKLFAFQFIALCHQ